MQRIPVILVVLVVLLTLSACDGRMDYVTCIDRVEPQIPGLTISEGGPTYIGYIGFCNETGEDLYILDESGQEIIWVESEGRDFYRSSNESEWRRGDSSSGYMEYSLPPVFPGGPKPKLPGTVVSIWTLEGRVGDTPFQIHGQTVYKPLPWSCNWQAPR